MLKSTKSDLSHFFAFAFLVTKCFQNAKYRILFFCMVHGLNSAIMGLLCLSVNFTVVITTAGASGNAFNISSFFLASVCVLILSLMTPGLTVAESGHCWLHPTEQVKTVNLRAHTAFRLFVWTSRHLLFRCFSVVITSELAPQVPLCSGKICVFERHCHSGFTFTPIKALFFPRF